MSTEQWSDCLPVRVGLLGGMAKSRQAKHYVEGPRREMTIAWKERVHAKLAEFKKTGKQPANLSQLAKMIPSDKAGIYRAFDLEADDPQTALSAHYIDRICTLLLIEPPAHVGDEQLERDLDVIRSLDPETRAAIIAIAKLKRG